MKNTPIFKEYLHWYRTGDTQYLSYIYSFLVYGKKLSFMDEELDSTAFRGWESVEKRLTDLTFDNDVLCVLQRIIAGLVDLPDDAPFGPKFGPGAVSEKDISGRIAKSNRLNYDPKIDRILFKGHFNNYGLNKELGFHPDKILPDPSKWNNAMERSIQYSTLRFVPKDVTKSRSICMEPNVYMFAQQGIADWLRLGMQRGAIRTFVDITDQSRNRDLGRYGSLTGDIDTIDLSSASDSVHIDLVRRIFPRRILYYLLGSRTADVYRSSTGETIRVKKFAPMGSALCFPVQCIIFTSIVVYAAILKAHGLAVGERVPLDSPWLKDVAHTVDSLFSRRVGYVIPGRRLFQPAAIYGDDICVDASLTDVVAHLLTSLGFEVNTSKSFRSSQCFRETCGGFYYGGVDVTPHYFRVTRYRGKIGPGSVASLIASANHAGDRYYLYTRRCLIHTLLDSELLGVRKTKSPNPILFSADREVQGALYSLRPRNLHLKWRNTQTSSGSTPCFQVNEVLCIREIADRRLRPSRRGIFALERYLYLQGGVTGGEGEVPAGKAASRTDEVGSRLAREWVPWRG